MALSIVTFYNPTVQEMLEVYGIVAKKKKKNYSGPNLRGGGGATLLVWINLIPSMYK